MQDPLFLLQLTELCSSFLFVEQSCLVSLSKVPRNAKKFANCWKANFHFFGHRRLILCHFKVKNISFAFLTTWKGLRNSMTFSFIIYSLSSSLMPFHSSYGMLVKKSLASLGHISSPRNCTRQPHCFGSASNPMQLSPNIMFTMKSRAFACLSFTMMQS